MNGVGTCSFYLKLVYFFNNLQLFTRNKMRNVTMTKEMQMMIDFEELCWKCTEDSIAKAKLLINTVDPVWAKHLVCFAVPNHRIFSWKLLGDLFEVFPDHSVPLYDTEFIHYLIVRGLLNNPQTHQLSLIHQNSFKTKEEYEQQVIPNTIEYIIKRDDVPSLSFYLSNHPDINLILTTVKVLGNVYSLINFAAFCGSLNTVKYLMIQGCSVDNKTLECAIQSGNEELIEFLVTKHIVFNKMLFAALVNHRNKIARWLIDSYHCEEDIYLPDLIQIFNTEMFINFIKTGRDVNEKNYMNMTALMVAAVQNNITLARYLISVGADRYHCDEVGQMAYHYATNEEMKSLLY